jgi:hypothetical protein
MKRIVAVLLFVSLVFALVFQSAGVVLAQEPTPSGGIRQLIVDNLDILVGLIFLAAAAAIAVWLIRQRSTSTGFQRDVIDALLPFVYRALLAGEKVAQDFMQNANVALAGVDKKQVADSVYALLPETISIRGVAVPIVIVKQIIPRDRFEQLVKDTYDAASAFIKRNQDYLRGQVDALVPDDYEPDKQVVRG